MRSISARVGEAALILQDEDPLAGEEVEHSQELVGIGAPRDGHGELVEDPPPAQGHSPASRDARAEALDGIPEDDQNACLGGGLVKQAYRPVVVHVAGRPLAGAAPVGVGKKLW